MHQVSMPGSLRDRRWTRLEMAIWLFALTFVIATGILLATQVVGNWVLPVGGLIVLALGLMRIEQKPSRRGETLTIRASK